MKKYLIILLIFILCIVVVINKKNNEKIYNELKIFNWGQFIDPKIIDKFEEENNIKIIYDTFDSNENMYKKIKTGCVDYDITFPSDYITEKMINENLLEELNFELISNFKNINSDLLNKPFDKQQRYSIPYFWGTVGIIYNKKKVDIKNKSWDILWDINNKNKIFMYYSVRDTLMIGLKKLGYSLNTQNIDEINKATDILIKLKTNIIGFLGDEIINAMINDQADISVCYSGDALQIMNENPNMEYFIPQDQGSNIWIDNVVILKNSSNKLLAHKFINFLCDDEISKLNSEFVGYSSPNIKTFEEMTSDNTNLMNNEAYNPDLKKLKNMEFFNIPSKKTNDIYNDCWEKILNS